MRVRCSYGLGIMLLLAGVASCSSSGRQGRAPSAGKAQAAACGASGVRALTPIGDPDVGSTIALARWRERRVAFVADEDERAVHAVDLETKRPIASHRLEGRPSQLMVLHDGRLVVTHRDRSELVVIEPSGDALGVRCSVPTAPDPVALAQSADRKTLFVTSAWGHKLGVYRAGDLARQREVDLPREPRGVAISSDGRTAFVAHAVGGRASAVDLSSFRVRRIELEGQPSPAIRRQRKRMLDELGRQGSRPADVAAALESFDESNADQRRTSCQGFALAKSVEPGGRILAPQVLVDPGDSTRRSSGYGEDAVTTEVPSVAVLDDRSGEPLPASLEAPSGGHGFEGKEQESFECLLPRAAIVDPGTQSLLVACLGIDAIVAYDAASATPARAATRTWPVASGPTGIALDPSRRRAVVWSQFDRALTFVPLDAAISEDPDRRSHKLSKIALPEDDERSLNMKTRLGRMLFHATGDRRIARDGRACASCHPDGRDDGLVWATPNGPRRSVMLAGRLKHTAPFAWDGEHADLEQHVSETFERLNGAGGLRSVELESLIAYIEALPAPPPSAPENPQLVERGRELFASADTGCARCHSGKAFTDNTRHDVLSKASADRTRKFNTPSLDHLSGRGPWFHDGRFRTLRELLTASDGKMGRTAHLSPSDFDALEAYLGTL